MNYVVKFLPALVVSVATLLEPVIGTLMAWAIFGEYDSIGVWTIIGGPILLGSCIAVTWAAHRRMTAAKEKEKSSTPAPG